jgi:eukaryotic-like serine/threonine-protein kinase
MSEPGQLTVRAGADGRAPAAPAAPGSDFGQGDNTCVAFPDRFHILRRLGAGGMAEVFVALRQEPDGSRTPVVIKRPLPHLLAHPEFVDMFLDEARIASSLRHPNIVGVHELVREAGGCLLVMELVDGKPLSSVVARIERMGQRLESRLSAYLVARAAAGLHHAHELRGADGELMQIVHRDVSPQNVLISFEGEVKVIDFGIARALGRVTNTKTGTRKGKTGYMAPEQAKSSPIDRRVDVFALGIVLWELLCGRRLFVRPDEYRTMNALLIDPILPPSRYAAVPPELENIVMRALDREVANRFASADDLRLALDAFVASVGGASARELGRAMKDAFPSAESLIPRDDDPSVGQEIGPAVLSRPTVALRSPSYPRRQRFLLVAGALAAASLGGGIGWVAKLARPQAQTVLAGRSAGPDRPGAGLMPVARPTPMDIEPLPPRGVLAIDPTTLVTATPPDVGGSPPVSAEDKAAAKASAARRRQARSSAAAELARKRNPF